MISRKEVEKIKLEYPAGTILELIEHLEDKYSKLEVGDKGKVTGVDDIGTIHMSWNRGGSLGLIVGEDKFRIIK